MQNTELMSVKSGFHPCTACLTCSVGLNVITDGVRCSVPAGPLDTSGRTTLVRFPDAEDVSSSSKVPAFPDFMEEVRSSWDRPASAPSVLKWATQLASLEDEEKLGLAGFPPVDSTIAALGKAPLVGKLARDPACPNPQCRVKETHLKRVYAAEAQLQYWHAYTSDAWVLTTVHNGYKLQFRLGPPTFQGITNTFMTDPLQASVLQKEVVTLLCKRAICLVFPTSHGTWCP
ncbi:UNVERIFIED_CONTAM: hypothetical protein FKN15_010187 [Acipenser sinensis]